MIRFTFEEILENQYFEDDVEFVRYEFYHELEKNNTTLNNELQKTREQLENKGTKIQELTALIVNYMGMTEVEKEKYYEVVLTFSKQEKIEHSIRKILNALDNQLEQELKNTREQLEKAEDVLRKYASENNWSNPSEARQYFKDKDKQGEG